jgi:hypothetical protein
MPLNGVGAVALLTAGYFLLPAHPGLSTHGVPLGPAGTAIVAAVVGLGTMLRRVTLPRPVIVWVSVAMAALAAARILIAGAATPPGWVARYYANERWLGTPEWSADFRRADATRIDSRISFRDDTFPVHYLNDITFSTGIRREVTQPMSVEWTGFVTRTVSAPLRVSLEARGAASLTIDDRGVLTITAPREAGATSADVDLSAGPHRFVVKYVKPPDTDGLVQFEAVDPLGGPPLEVTQTATARSPSALLALARLADGAALAAFGFVSAWAVRLVRPRRDRAGWMVPSLLFALFGVQGWMQALPLAGRVVALTGGDDWWGFEACARDILRHGPLMTLGKAVGRADPYFYHPLYCYFLAAVHAVTGETLFGPVFVQFLILAIVGTIVWRLASEIFGQRPALAGLVALVAIFELDFARYYTVTLLSENLYILTATSCLVPFVRWVRGGRRADLIRMAIWGGISTMTRPPMLFYLFPAVVLVALVAAGRSRRPGETMACVALVAGLWLLTVSPITLRNLFVSHRFVLVSDVQSASVLTYNIPASLSAAEYGARWHGTFGSALRVIAEMSYEHPLAMSGVFAKKLAFSLGMTQLIEGYRPHPELVAVTMMYVVMCIASSRMLARALWPVHLFVLTHLASMLLTMPWNYGYRLIMPPFVYTSALSAAAFGSMVMSRRARFGVQVVESRA